MPCHNTVKRDLVDPSSGRTWPGTDVLYCNLTRDHVPVRASRSPSSPVVGYLEQGGAANWFVTELKGETYRDGAGENGWWAGTQADNGRWGWTPEVYFAGGGNYEDDAGLLVPGSYTCAKHLRSRALLGALTPRRTGGGFRIAPPLFGTPLQHPRFDKPAHDHQD
ncbi:hypothetical protein ABZS99_25095 [Streptomyces sp. NPDC005463]|uniref:hypothetical protein n=1 Tax=Streptomyces sp. NPDC005463 TaxID=3154465 RepID=UPI0033A807F1